MTTPQEAHQRIPLHAAAEMLGVHPATVRRWEKEGKIRAYRTAGGHRYFSKSELENFLKEKPLTAKEAAAYLGISPATLRRIVQQGRIAPIKQGGARPYYTEAILAEYQKGLERRTDKEYGAALLPQRPMPPAAEAPPVPTPPPAGGPAPIALEPLPATAAVPAFQERKSEMPASGAIEKHPAPAVLAGGSSIPPDRGGRGASSAARIASSPRPPSSPPPSSPSSPPPTSTSLNKEEKRK